MSLTLVPRPVASFASAPALVGVAGFGAPRFLAPAAEATSLADTLAPARGPALEVSRGARQVLEAGRRRLSPAPGAKDFEAKVARHPGSLAPSCERVEAVAGPTGAEWSDAGPSATRPLAPDVEAASRTFAQEHSAPGAGPGRQRPVHSGPNDLGVGPTAFRFGFDFDLGAPEDELDRHFAQPGRAA